MKSGFTAENTNEKQAWHTLLRSALIIHAGQYLLQLEQPKGEGHFCVELEVPGRRHHRSLNVRSVCQKHWVQANSTENPQYKYTFPGGTTWLRLQLSAVHKWRGRPGQAFQAVRECFTWLHDESQQPHAGHHASVSPSALSQSESQAALKLS